MRTTRRRFLRAALSLTVAVLVSITALSPSTALAQRDTITIAIPSDMESFDPHLSGGLSMRLWTNVYETLLSRTADGKLVPRLAESWRQISPTEWEFKIRPGLKFTSGNPLNAKVIAETFVRKNDKASPHTHVSFTTWIKNARAVDDRTLVIETEGPFPAALFYLANPMPGAIYDFKARDEWGTLKTKSSGTGAYVLDKIEPGQYVQLRRNPDYWGPKAKTEYLRFRIIPEETTRVLALRRGEVDLLLDMGPDALAQLKDDPNISTNVFRIYRVNTIEYNFMQPLIRDNPKLREAIRLAVDTRGIVKAIVGVKGDPADSVVLDSSWGYSSIPEFLKSDPAKARQILDQEGWKAGPDGIRERKGEKLNLVFVTDFTRDYRNREIAQAVQASLRTVGIGVEAKMLERGPFIDAVIQKGEGYHLNIQGWGSPTNEASWWIFTRLHSKNQALGAWGTTRNRDVTLDGMIDKARTETNEAKAIPLWSEVQRKVYTDSLMIPLYFANGIQAVRKNVDGFVTHPDEWYGYRYLNAVVK